MLNQLGGKPIVARCSEEEAQESNAHLTGQTSPPSTDSRPAPYLGIIARPAGGCYIFNQLRFSPVRTSGTVEEGRALIASIRERGPDHLSADLRELLRRHGIISAPRNADRQRAMTEYSGQEFRDTTAGTPFTIRLATKIDDINRVKHQLREVTRDLLSREGNGQAPPTIKMKFLWTGTHQRNRLGHIGIIATYALRELGVAPEFYVELPVHIMTRYVDGLLTCRKPSLRVNSVITGPLGQPQINALARLANAGFRPNCIFEVSSVHRVRMEESIKDLARQIEPGGFTINIRPCRRIHFSNDHIYAQMLPTSEELCAVMDLCYTLENIDLSQMWLYADLKKRVDVPGFLLPCRTCAGRGMWIDGQGRCASCHGEAAQDVLNLQDSPADVTVRSTDHILAGSTFAREHCRTCPLRFYCGGICDHIAVGTQDVAIIERVFQMSCDLRKQALFCFLEDATREGGVQPPRRGLRARFTSGDGRLEVVRLDESRCQLTEEGL